MSGSYQGRRVLVTGAGGFLGRVLCHQLVQQGAFVIGIGRNPPLSASFCVPNTPSNIFLALDLTDPLLQPTLAAHPVDTIFHLAGKAKNTQSLQVPTNDFNQNLVATIHLLDALRAIHFTGHLVFASSAAVYGQPRQLPITEESLVQPLTPYGMSKLAAEGYVRVFAQSYHFSMTIARLFSLYGPGQRKQVIYDLCQKALGTQGVIRLWGDGSEMRDFTYVDDAANMLIRLAEGRTTHGHLFNVCSGQGITIAEAGRQVMLLLGEDPTRLCFCGTQRDGDVTAWVGCNRKLHAIGISPQYNLSAGLAATVQWFWQEERLNHAATA